MIQIELDGDGALHRQIERAIRSSILGGRLAPGQRLPSTRDLASILGVSRPVVQLAYQQLCVEGYARARVGSGTYVEDGLPEQYLAAPARSGDRACADESPDGQPGAGGMPPALSRAGRRIADLDIESPLRAGTDSGPDPDIDFRSAVPTSDVIALRTWRTLLRRHAGRLSASDLDLSGPAGYGPLREAIASHLRTHRAVRCTPNEVVVVNGTQQGLDLLVRLFVDEGQTAAIEDPHYLGARDVLVAAGARLLALPVDDQGLDPAPLLRSRRRVRFVYTTPSHQYPSGSTMSAARRFDLLNWAEGRDAVIIEDDYDGEFRYDANLLPSMQGQDRSGRVVYLGTFSKVLFPAMRLGFVVLPPALVQPFLRAKWLADYESPIHQQLALAEFLAAGHFLRHLRRARRDHLARREALLSAFDTHLAGHAVLAGHQAGVHASLRFPEFDQASLSTLISMAAERRVRVRSSAPYYLSPDPPAELILGFGALSKMAIREGLRRLGEIVATGPQSGPITPTG